VPLRATTRTRKSAPPFAPNAFLEIDERGQVTIYGFRSEMGQGIETAVAMIVADELEADWKRVRVVPALADPKYGNMRVGGSRSVRENMLPLRRSGAAARELLLEAAARQLQVNRDSLTAIAGVVTHGPTGRRLAYGDLVALAATLPVPSEPLLKDPKDFRFIGKRVARTDTPAKVDGSARFGIDVRMPGMAFAVVVRPPSFGAKLVGVDDSATRRLGGSAGRQAEVVRLDNAVAVVADTTWKAMRAAQALRVTWDESAGEVLSTTTIREELVRRGAGPAAVARAVGDTAAALGAGTRRIEAVYEVPYLAHATMEPQNCTVWVKSDGCEMWAPTQNPIGCQEAAMEILDLPREKVTVHTTYLGGGFGRRGETDYAREAVKLGRILGRPVQVVWSREDDMRNDFYRPATWNRFEAAFDAGGQPVAWYHCISGPSIRSRFGPLKDGLDSTSVEGAANLPYGFPNLKVDYCRADLPIPVGFWRSVGSSQNAFVTEGFVDEVAHATGEDPVAFRLRWLTDERARAVVRLAADRAGWGSPLPAGRGRGIAFAFSFGSYVAQVAEVSVVDGRVKVHRVVCAVDCGQVVNPDTIEAQMESGIAYGLSAALYGEITVERGRVLEANFDRYPILRMAEMPRVEVHLAPSGDPPGGIGEPGTPPIAPAVVNAVFAATGVRVRRLPIRL
jgi:isoquinoline 1-oxidoreductase beta subunit